MLPAELREMDGVKAGEHFEIERLEAGRYLLKHQRSPNNAGVVDWLLACPTKGWFVSVQSESTDAL